MPDSPQVVRRAAPGKVILLGEHAVVYGRAALAASIDRYVEVEAARTGGAGSPVPRDGSTSAPRWAVPPEALCRAAELTGVDPREITASARATMPSGAGLGSSAGLSVALIRALAALAGQSLSDATLCGRAFEIEKIFHGFPSGIDNTVATYGGLLAFKHGTAPRPVVLPRPLPLVIAVGRAPRETQKVVRGLRQRWEANPERYEPLFDAIDGLVREAETAIGTADLRKLGCAMRANHDLLQHMGISTEELDRMVALADAGGALGAKLTGGGGGGAVIALCDGDRERLVNAFLGAGWDAFATDITGREHGRNAGDDPGRFGQRDRACG
ncbi:MAG: mevalonate kinase [Candidatus Binatia bacterium]